MTHLTITHTPAEGTLVHGTAKGDGAADILKARRFRWGRSIGCWYLPHSRDKVHADTYRIDAAQAALEDAGFTVTVDIGHDDRRDVADREHDRAERADARAERHDRHADRAAENALGRYEQAHSMAQAIPLGQPILVGHHSEKRDRAYRDRMHRQFDKAADEQARSDYHAHRAESAEVGQRLRHNPRVTMRRLEKLQADRRRIDRALDDDGRQDKDRLAAMAADLDSQIIYWLGELSRAKEAGFRQYGPGDVRRGDQVRTRHGWHQVVRVNQKSVSIPHILEGMRAAGRTWRLRWDQILDVQETSESERTNTP